MNKAAIASLLVISAYVPASRAFAQTPVPATGQVQMPADEFADYDNAMNKQTTPQTQAPALEAYLAKYPKSTVKNDVLQRIMLDYSQVNLGKAAAAADNYLMVNPTNLQAYIIEVAYHQGNAAAAGVDPATKQTELDAAAGFAQKGIDASKQPKPADLTADQFTAIKNFATPTFYGVIAADKLNAKDVPSSIAAYKSELDAMPPFDPAAVNGADPAKKQAALTYLQETYSLGSAYYSMTPPDYVNCTFYTTRAAIYAPAPFNDTMQKTASYCYKKFHGTADGYDAVIAAAKTNTTYPTSLVITPAPTPADIVHGIITTTADLATLALSDKEFILQYGEKADADKVFDTIKGKSVQIPGAIVIESSPTVLKVAVSDDAVQGKTADFTFNMKPMEEPKTPAGKKQAAEIAAATAVGQKVNLQGTYDSYTPSPIMIIMNEGEVVLPKAKPAAAPARRPAHK